MTHLLVTNDYPPKIGGIQNYLWELYRRMPPDKVAVFTTPYEGDAAFDAAQTHRIERFERFWLSPTPDVTRRVEVIADRVGADSVLFDPAVPVGAIGPSLSRPYGVVLHGAEVSVPCRIPGARSVLARTVDRASLTVSASPFATVEAERLVGRPLDALWVPPGVDVERFVPGTDAERLATRERYGIAPDVPLLLSVSRLVPRKGMDRFIEASAALIGEFPDLQALIVGGGRDEGRLRRLIAARNAPVRMLGRLPDAELPALYAAADVFVMLCRVRWGGLEQEGFGIVFMEAAAAGVPQVAGASGGAADAVVHGETGLVVSDPNDPAEAATAIAELLRDPDRRARMGVVGRQRAIDEFSYDLLADRLCEAMDGLTT